MEKISILFVCLGNICRSPMAEFVMKNIVAQKNLSNIFEIASAATSREEEGNPIHYGTRRKLSEKGVPFENHYATVIKRSDYEKYDYIIGMDHSNIRNLISFFGGDRDEKIKLLLSFTDDERSVADPWYTGDFDKTYDDILTGCTALADWLTKKYGIK